jgi:hypothetical protein
MKKASLSVATLCSMLIWSSSSLAGWHGSGGQLFQDANNPWFLQNTREVSYCTIFGPNFSLDHAKADQLVAEAFKFWKYEFSYGNEHDPGSVNNIQVATQNFKKVDCPGGRADVDIAFQFDYLDDEQKKRLSERQQYAGIAMRTDYDTFNVRGKGFVYIGADMGTEQFRGRNLVELPWSYNEGSLLYWTLVHEIGHIFGLQHSTQDAKNKNVMSFNFVETILDKYQAKLFHKSTPMLPVFDLPKAPKNVIHEICLHSMKMKEFDQFRKFFFIENTDDMCISIASNSEGLKVYVSVGGVKTLAGSASFYDSSCMQEKLVNTVPALEFWLPEVVNTNIFPTGTKYVNVPKYKVTEQSTYYISANKKNSRPITIYYDPRITYNNGNSLRIGGIMDGHLYPNIFLSLPAGK